jgi:hypothetical protein
MTSPDALFVARRVQILTLAARDALPAIYHRREFADAGGLMSYGSSLADQFRQTGVYVGRILKGENPADMPVQRPTAGGDTIYAAKQGELPGLRIVSSYQSPSPIPRVGIAVRKGDGELLGKINSSLAKLEAEGTVKAIFAKYGVDDWAPPK